MKIGPYRCTHDKGRGRLVVHDVEIFVTCKRGKFDFDEPWIKGALLDAQQGEAEGYFPPVHIDHHGKSDSVTAVGVFRMKRIEPRVHKGQNRPTLIADMIVTNPEAIDLVLAGRLPYRSVEIFDARSTKIDSLSLLDHEPPFLELPAMVDVQGSTKSVDRVHDEAEPVLSFHRTGERAVRVLMENDMSESPSYKPVVMQKDDEDEKPAEPYEGEETPAEEAAEDVADADAGEALAEGSEPMAEADPVAEDPAAVPEAPVAEDGTWLDETQDAGAMNVDAVIGAIRDGTIAVKDFHAIQQAMSAVETAVHGEEPPMEEAPQQPQEAVQGQPPVPPAAAPAEAMQRSEEPQEASQALEAEKAEPQTTEREAILMARVDALEAKDAQRELEDKISEAVSGALTRLEGRALGENPGERYTAFARKHGLDAFEAYIGELESSLPATQPDRFAAGPEAFDFGRPLPKEVMAYQEAGDDAVAEALRFSRQYDELEKRGMVRVDRERYLEIQMKGVGGLK